MSFLRYRKRQTGQAARGGQTMEEISRMFSDLRSLLDNRGSVERKCDLIEKHNPGGAWTQYEGGSVHDVITLNGKFNFDELKLIVALLESLEITNP